MTASIPTAVKSATFVHACFGSISNGPASVVVIDLPFAGFNYGYNRTVMAERVHDLLSVIAHLYMRRDVKRVHLLATDVEPGAPEAEVGPVGPWRQPELLDVEGERRVDVVDVDGHVVHSNRLHATEYRPTPRVPQPIAIRPTRCADRRSPGR